VGLLSLDPFGSWSRKTAPGSGPGALPNGPVHFQESMFLSPDLSLACAVVAFPWRPSSQLTPWVPSHCTLTCHAAAPKVPLPIASPASLGDDPSKWDPAECDALLHGGEQVAFVLQEMLTLVRMPYQCFFGCFTCPTTVSSVASLNH
jgi:hypothetical protein